MADNCIVKEDILKKYFDITGRAIKKIKFGRKKDIKWKEAADDFLDMAKRYYTDAEYFYRHGNVVTAFAALNYAHGWLDAGARIGLFDVHDSKLFTVDDKSTRKKMATK